MLKTNQNKILLFLSSILIFNVSYASAIDIGTCPYTANVDGGQYDLTGNLVCTQNGITITANNVVVDGHNWEINYSGSAGTGRGIISTGTNNITVKNMFIQQNAGLKHPSSYGVSLTNVQNSFFSALIITTNGDNSDDFDIDGSSNNNFSQNNVFTHSGIFVDGFWLHNSANHNVFFENLVDADGDPDDVGYSFESGSTDNTVIGGIVTSDTPYHYQTWKIQNGNGIMRADGTAPNVGWSSDVRRIRFYIDPTSIFTFNYTNTTSNNVWLNTSTLTASILSRSIYNWTQNNITIRDNISVSTTYNYTTGNLSPYIIYQVSKNGVLGFTLPTDGSGALSFGYDLTANTTNTITVNSTGISTNYSLLSSNSTPHKIFKCQASTITANFSGFGNIANVFLHLTNTLSSAVENFTMTPNGAGMWSYSYGNDNTTAWGNKTISFVVMNTTGIITNISTTNYIFVYSDPCTGSNIQGYRNTTYRTAGFGNYTRALFTGQQNLLEFAVKPSLNTFGSLIYILMMFLICVVIYMKNQSVIQPIIIAFIVSASLIASNLMPQEYRIYALFLTGIAVAAIFWRLGKSA